MKPIHAVIGEAVPTVHPGPVGLGLLPLLELVFEVEIDSIPPIRVIQVRLFPHREVKKPRKRDVRKLGPGWIEVAGPFRCPAGFRYRALRCVCDTCEGRHLYLVLSAAESYKGAAFSRLHVKIPDLQEVNDEDDDERG